MKLDYFIVVSSVSFLRLSEVGVDFLLHLGCPVPKTKYHCHCESIYSRYIGFELPVLVAVPGGCQLSMWLSSVILSTRCTYVLCCTRTLRDESSVLSVVGTPPCSGRGLETILPLKRLIYPLI